MQFLLPYIGNRKGILPGNIPSPPPALQPDMGNDATDDFLTLDAVNSEGVDDPGIRDEVSGSAADEGSGNAVNEGSGNAADEDFPTADLAPVSHKKRKVDPVDECVMEFIRKKQSTEKRTESPRKLFLMSLEPEVEEMTAAQFRAFRRRVGLLVDEILDGSSFSRPHSSASFSTNQSANSAYSAATSPGDTNQYITYSPIDQQHFTNALSASVQYQYTNTTLDQTMYSPGELDLTSRRN